MRSSADVEKGVEFGLGVDQLRTRLLLELLQPRKMRRLRVLARQRNSDRRQNVAGFSPLFSAASGDAFLDVSLGRLSNAPICHVDEGAKRQKRRNVGHH